jgi:hypothetical protein
MWYAVIALVTISMWEAVCVISSIFVLKERSEFLLARYNPWFNFFRNLLCTVHLILMYTLLELNNDTHAPRYLCFGWNVWVAMVLPRYLLMAMFFYDVSYQLMHGEMLAAMRRSYYILAGGCALIVFAAMTLYDTVSADSKGRGCHMTTPVELMNLLLTLVCLFAICVALLFPPRQFLREVIHRRVVRIGGCDITSILNNECYINFLPATFPELDMFTAVRHDAPHLLDRDREITEEDTLPLGVTWDFIHMARRETSPLGIDLPTDNIDCMLQYDPRTRHRCTLVTVLMFFFCLPLTHFGNATYHPAWKFFILLLYSTPIVLWQWLCSVRPAMKSVTRDRFFFDGFNALTIAEEMRVRPEYTYFDYGDMLQYYMSNGLEATGRDAELVDAFLRATNRHTGRDRFKEFYLWWCLYKRREEPIGIVRDAINQFIIKVFFRDRSRLFIEFDRRLLDMILSPGDDVDNPQFFDDALKAVVIDLDMRDAALEIKRTLKERQKELDTHGSEESIARAANPGAHQD